VTVLAPCRLEVLVEEPSAEEALKTLLPKIVPGARLVGIAHEAGLPADATLFRIVIEELEAWFLGDVPALHAAYPKVPPSLGSQTKFRDPENVSGGAWEGLEHVLQKHGYHRKGLQKVRAATDIAPHMDIENNRSKSFQVFRDGLRRLVKEGN
jgi:hypothetical protein